MTAHRKMLRAAVFGMAFVLGIILGPLAATAAPPAWNKNPLIGCGGQTSGGYVVAAQSFLGSYGAYWGYIDNYYGSVTSGGILNYQNDRHLSRKDGCAGSETWGDMQSLLQSNLATYYCGFGNLHQNFLVGYVTNRSSEFGSATGWTSQTNNPTASPVVGSKDYLQSSSLTVLC